MARRFSSIAEKVVANFLLKEPKSEDRKKKAQEKLLKAYETDERLRTVRDFMQMWNRWREFYFGLGPLKPKNSGQLTMIENAISFAKENEFDLNMLIACVHYAYKNRKFNPSYSAVSAYGEEYYEKFYESVLADIDNKEYQESSERRV